MIDWHCHILPGLDDGATDSRQALAMAAALSTAGFSTVYCTPHYMRGCYEAGNDQVRRGVVELQQLLQEEGIPLQLRAGREYCLDEYLLAALDDPLPLGESRLILIEILPHLSVENVRQLLYGVVCRGFTPVIAHPERCRLLEALVCRPGRPGWLASLRGLLAGGRTAGTEPDLPGSSGNPLLDYLRDLGCSFQGNLGSWQGFYGRRVQAAAGSLEALGLYERYGSDLHAPEQAGIVLKAAGRRPPQQ